MGSKSPLQGHHPATPGYRVQSMGALLEEALMEKLFWKASAGILEEPPSPAERRMLRQGSRGGSHQSSAVLPLLKPAPLRGRQGESEHPRVLPSLLPAVCLPRCWCCQALPSWVLWLPKPERCRVPRDAGPLLPAPSSIFLSCFFG